MDFLDQEIDLDSEWSNKRTAVRYLRNDIKAAVKVHSLWFPRLFPVLLRDISSRGAAIVTSHKIKKAGSAYFYCSATAGGFRSKPPWSTTMPATNATASNSTT